MLKNSRVKSEFSAAGIKKAGKALDVMRMSEDEYINYQAYLKMARVKDNEWESAMYESELKGKAEGEKRKAMEIAKNLKSLGMPLPQISQAAGLTIEEIENL